jgi:FkbM family methyltransferase
MIKYNVVVPTVYGDVIVNRNDNWQGQMVFGPGISPSHKEIEVLCSLAQMCGPGAVAMDIGANVGFFSLALGKALAPLGGKVWSIEAQRLIFNMVAGTMALNCMENVYVYNWAIGKELGEIPIPQYDLSKPGSFGSVEFMKEAQDVGQSKLADKPDETVPLINLDSLELERVDIMKIDVEGMESDLLEGGKDMFTRLKPIVWIEWLKSDKNALIMFFKNLGYNVYEHGIDLLCIMPDRFPEFQSELGHWVKF